MTLIVWRSRGNIIRTAPCWVVWHNVHSPQHTHMNSSYRSRRSGCHTGTPTLCIEAVAQSCIIVTWWSGPGGIQALSDRPTGFLHCFDTVGLVIWPVKIVPDMTYNVFGATLNLAQFEWHNEAINCDRQYSCVRQAERRKWSSVWHWLRSSTPLSTSLVRMWLMSQFTSTSSCYVWSCRQLSSSSTRLSCVKFVVARPATPPAISESNIISQPRPTRPCLPSCWSSLRSSMSCSTACVLSPSWRSGSRKLTSRMTS